MKPAEASLSNPANLKRKAKDMGVTARHTMRRPGSDAGSDGFLCHVAMERVRPEHAKDRKARIERENADARLKRTMMGTLFYVEVFLRVTVTLVYIYISLISPGATPEERRWSIAILTVVLGKFIWWRRVPNRVFRF
jgi:hypothetical protein